MAKLSDTKIPITEFLEAYRRQPCLYNTLLDTYKNRVSRDEAYGAIIKSLKVPQLTVTDIKLKIKSIRTVYSKELRIWMREKELGRNYEPKLFWFKLADSFLRSVSLSHGKRIKNKNVNTQALVKREPTQKVLFNPAADLCMSEDALQEEGDQELDPEELEDTESMKPSESNCLGEVASVAAAVADAVSGKTELIIDDSAMCVIEPHQPQLPLQSRKLKFTVSHPQQPTAQPAPVDPSASFSGDDDLMFFGQSIASQLRTITDPYSRSVAKLRIQQVLFQAETGHFQNNGETVNPHLHSFQ